MHSRPEKNSSINTSFLLFFLSGLGSALSQTYDSTFHVLNKVLPLTKDEFPKLGKFLPNEDQQSIFNNTWHSLKNLKSEAFDLEDATKDLIQEKVNDSSISYFQLLTLTTLTTQNHYKITDSYLNTTGIHQNSSGVTHFLENNKDAKGKAIYKKNRTMTPPLGDLFASLIKKEWQSLYITPIFLLDFAQIQKLPLSHQKFICKELKKNGFTVNNNRVCGHFNPKNHKNIYTSNLLPKIGIILTAYFTYCMYTTWGSLEEKKSIQEVLKSYIQRESLNSNTFTGIESHINKLSSLLKQHTIEEINKGFEEIFKHHDSYVTTKNRITPITQITQGVLFLCIEKMFLNIYPIISTEEFRAIFATFVDAENFDYPLLAFTTFADIGALILIHKLSKSLTTSLRLVLTKDQIQSLSKEQHALNTLALAKLNEESQNQTDHDHKKTKKEEKIYKKKPVEFDPDQFKQQKIIFDGLYNQYTTKIAELKKLYYSAKGKISGFNDSSIRSLIAKETHFDFGAVYHENSPSEINLKNLNHAILNIETEIASITNNRPKITKWLNKNKSSTTTQKRSKNTSSSATTIKALQEKKSEIPAKSKKTSTQGSLQKPKQQASTTPLKKEEFKVPAKKPSSKPEQQPSSVSTPSKEDERLQNPYVQESRAMFGDLLDQVSYDQKQIPQEAVGDMEILLKTFWICIACNYFYDFKKLRNNALYYLDDLIKDKGNFNELWSTTEKFYFFLSGSVSKLPDSPLIQKIRESHFSLDQHPKLKMFEQSGYGEKASTIMDQIERVKESEYLTYRQKYYLNSCLKQLQTTFLKKADVPVTREQNLEAIKFRHGLLKIST